MEGRSTIPGSELKRCAALQRPSQRMHLVTKDSTVTPTFETLIAPSAGIGQSKGTS